MKGLAPPGNLSKKIMEGITGVIEEAFEEHAIPAHLRPGLLSYFTDYAPPSGFLQAMLANDLHYALKKHDGMSSLDDLIDLFLHIAPSQSWGSWEKVWKWTVPELRGRLEISPPAAVRMQPEIERTEPVRPRANSQWQRHDNTPLPANVDPDLRLVHGKASELREVCRDRGFTVISAVIPNDFSADARDPKNPIVCVTSGHADLMAMALPHVAEYLMAGYSDFRANREGEA